MDKIIIEYFNEVYPEQLRKIKILHQDCMRLEM